MTKWAWLAIVGAVLLLSGGGVVMLANTAESRRNEERYAPAIATAERAQGIPSGLLHRLLYQESRFRTDIITGATVSPVGAQGIAQFMPATAAEVGIDPLDPQQAIIGAARYLRRLYDALGEWRLAVAAYNAGIGNVRKYGGVPPFDETRKYVAAIMQEGTASA